jgi:hypothetical protein
MPGVSKCLTRAVHKDLRTDEQWDVSGKQVLDGRLGKAMLRTSVVCEAQEDVRIDEETHQS